VRQLDPDILIGWDVQKGGLGYLADRAAVLGINLLRAASRTPELAGLKERQDDAWGRDNASGIHCTGAWGGAGLVGGRACCAGLWTCI